MASSVQSSTSSSSSQRTASAWSPLGGERFYAMARWLMIMLLGAVTQFLSNGNLWPITTNLEPLTLIFLLYAGFALIMTVLTFIPAVAGFVSLSYLFDIAFISLMAFVGGERIVIFFPLYLLPLTYAAIRQPLHIGVLSGALAAVAYMAAFIGWRRLIAPEALMTMLDYVALGLRGLTLAIVPWVTGNLAERQSETNRQRVIQAQQDAERALQEAHAYRDQMRSLYQVALTLGATADYRQVLETLLRESRKIVPYRAGVVLLSSGQPNELYVAFGSNLAPGDLNRSFQMDTGLAAALRATTPQMITSFAQFPTLQQIGALRDCTSAALIPLQVGMRAYGLFVVATDQMLRSDQVEMLTALANYAIVALHNAQLIYDLKEEREKLLSREEEVRHQLARDLHDGPAQSMAVITMKAEFIKRLLERDPAQALVELDELSTIAKRTNYEVRTMLFELRPLMLETQGLKVTLEQYLDRLRAKAGDTSIILEAGDIDQLRLGSKVEGALFNMIQESVTNAIKHAKAAHIWVRLRRFNHQTLEVVIEDDGVGFDKMAVLRSYERRGSLGLLNIDERARLVGGRAEIDSTPGKGTRITIFVPVEQ
ncbi:MAG: putative sensor-like histidine kinase [Pirellulaceae bacterium]|uniref:GAF domain-containing sensor histidine kinase n=1 Tax=Chloroflexus sp. TaxID=1904827 RepID=UPI0021DECC32|nr:GAF domain-containing sensor histidine kinase [Chloroflexus sp.]GIV88572.1 MAG: putative sensor-like histidine kinase [Chloroflexus sp.]GIW91744.1 MAG: putative sensor-like histidine kinase [Pirellulaceae bacterium]GIW91773.1 MAG: putative sensor-like histidine kinase [Pirellulaceae bacterium]